MIKEQSCICKIFNTLHYGQLIKITFLSGVEAIYYFIKIKDNCVYLKGFNSYVVIECNSILYIECLPKETCQPTIHIDNPNPISCHATITGRVYCGLLPIPGVIVNLTSNPDILNFSNNMPVTNLNGEFTTDVTIASETTPQEIALTATVNINNTTYEHTIYFFGGCHNCQNPTLELTEIPTSVNCETGSPIEGYVRCNGVGVSNAMVLLNVIPSDEFVYIDPKMVFTDNTGKFSTTIFSTPGVTETVDVEVTAIIAGQEITETITGISVNCPGGECSQCGFLLVSSAVRNVTVNIIRFGHPETLVGIFNINVLECGRACNPANDIFGFNFNASGNSYQFTNGRRIQVTCNGNTVTVHGVAQGSVNNGVKLTYIVDIVATLANNQIAWHVTATNDATNTSFDTTFTAAASPQSYIVKCP